MPFARNTCYFRAMAKHNFYAGPAILPKAALNEAAQAVNSFSDMDLSILEISHRSPQFTAVMEEARSLVKELLGLSNDYEVLFLQGGASTQFLSVPFNLHKKGGFSTYIDTGTWSSKAIKEAKFFGETKVLGSSKDNGYKTIPSDFSIPDDASYFHCTSNNTIYGTQMHSFPKANCPIVVDMSSDIFCKDIDYSQFDLIYAGAQKNLGPAGTTIVIVKPELLGKTDSDIPTMLDYRTHIGKGSMFNTPPVFPVYVCLLTLRWLKANGGTAAMEQKNRQKADKLYGEIDRNSLLEGLVAKEDRSLMNVTFRATKDGIDDAFIQACTDANIVGLKGHRSVGGFRASIYNALPESSVDHLISVMQDFENKNK